DYKPHRFALPAPSREPVACERIDLAAGGEQQQLVRGLRLEHELQPVAGLEALLVDLIDVALQGADPAPLGEHDGDRLALDEGGSGFLVQVCAGGRADRGTATSDGALFRIVLPERL